MVSHKLHIKLEAEVNMADLGAGRSTPRRNSDVSLGLVGFPTTQESIPGGDGFMFDFNSSIDATAEVDAAINAHIDAFCANPGLPDGQSLNDLYITPDLSLTTNSGPSESYQAYIPTQQYFTDTYSGTDTSSFPVQQNFTYPAPQEYYSAHDAPYFDHSYNALDQAEDPFGMSLTAIPGNNSFVDYGITEYATQQYANPVETWMVPAEVSSLPTMQMGYMPIDSTSYNDTSVQFATYPKGAQAAMTTSEFTAGPLPSAVGKEGPGDDLFDSDSDSDDDYREIEVKHKKTSRRATQKRLRKGSSSSAGTSAVAPDEPVKYQPGEKPQRVDAKPWIRTNANTEGDTRTAKINHWKNKYEYKPLPLGTWSSGKHTFKYTQYENVDFLTEAPMSTRKIKEYIMKYPCDDHKRLVLWIQKMPADQGRRYGSKQHSKCVFRDCPMQRYVEGTISTGEYRVAFDEKHFTYGDSVDPYDCSAYAHLYCMEQFLDFELVCQTVDVRVDTRIDMPLEPNGKAAFSMVDVPSRHEMEHFVKAASKGKLHQTQRWHQYPYHADYSRDQQKPHEHTLTYLAHCMYEAHQDDSHKKQAALRKVTVSQRRVHLGDLEMSVADKRILIEVYGGKKKGRHANIEDHYDERILCSIARAEQDAKDFLELKRRGKKSTKKVMKRKLIEPEETDGEESVYESARRYKRACRQKKQRVNYAESAMLAQHQCAQPPYTQPQSCQPVEQQVQHLQSYMTEALDHQGESAQAQLAIDPTLETPYGLYTVPITPKYDISDFSSFPTCEDDLPDDNLEKLLALERRQSCMEDFEPSGILKSPGLFQGGRTPRSAGFGRRAFFETQPVTESKEYRTNDPPRMMSNRRSARLAGKQKGDELSKTFGRLDQ